MLVAKLSISVFLSVPGFAKYDNDGNGPQLGFARQLPIT
jgi:hypothetical protein